MVKKTFPPESEIPKLPDDVEKEEEKKEALTLGARLLFIAVAIIGIGGLIWGGWQFNQSIKAPFLPVGGETVSGGSEISDLIALQTKDTDEDGLNDYDELYVYDTSPYLKDTDSDGFDEKQEIESGHDPNCPAGRDCSLSATVPGGSVTTPQVPDTSEIDQFLAGDLSADQIREILLEAGVPQAELDQVGDEALIQLYQEALAEQAADLNNQTNTSSGTTGQTSTETEIPDFQNMTADEVRALLIEQQAISQTELDQIDDETLMQIWQEILAEEGI